jgi:hypothetical protein
MSDNHKEWAAPKKLEQPIRIISTLIAK